MELVCTPSIHYDIFICTSKVPLNGHFIHLSKPLFLSWPSDFLTSIFFHFPLFCPPGPPSAPRNVISSINETSVILDWSWPEDTGGRRDITFTVLCKRCRGVTGNGSAQRCEPCRSNVRFLPRAAGLHNTTVTVGDLLAHTNYTFEIEALNGVSALAPKMRQYAAVTITTNQAGKMSQQMATWHGLSGRHMNLFIFSFVVTRCEPQWPQFNSGRDPLYLSLSPLPRPLCCLLSSFHWFFLSRA